MRENLAYEAEQRGEVYVWPRARLESTLAFVYLHEREEDPFIRALEAAVRELWNAMA